MNLGINGICQNLAKNCIDVRFSHQFFKEGREMNRRKFLKSGLFCISGVHGVLKGNPAFSENSDTNRAHAFVRRHNGVPTLFLDGKPVFYSGMWVTTPSPKHWGHAPESWPHPHRGDSDTAQRTAATGAHIYAFGVGHEWRGPGEGYDGHFDFSDVKASFQRIINADPEARFHLRINLECQRWWEKAYPNECEVTSEGRQPVPSYASTVWRDEAIEFLRRYVAHIREIGMAERVIAYQVMAGETGEWTRFSSSGAAPCGDYSEPMRRHFRWYLREKYGGDAALLRNAWSDANISFETADVPNDAEQLETKHFHFRDPGREQKTIDYFLCLADLCSGLVVDYCRSVKEANRGTALAGAFYGYTMTCAYNETFYNQGTHAPTEYSHYQRGGHLGFWKVLNSPCVDFVVSPISYGFRGIGGDGPSAFLEESVRLHGKFLIIEDDTRLHDTPPGTRYGRARNSRESAAILTRNFARAVCRGQGQWRAPYGIPEFHTLLRRFNRIGEFALLTERSPSAEVAVLIDEESIQYGAVRYPMDLANLSHQTLMGLARFGAPYDLYHLNDFADGNMPSYKLYIFLNAFCLTSARRRRLIREIQKDGRTALWIYAPGYIDGSGFSLDAMHELTGFTFDKNDFPWPFFMHITDFTHPATRDIPQDLFWNYAAAIGPIFSLRDESMHVLGDVVFSQGECLAGMGIQTFANWTSLYCAVPNIPAPVLRGIARSAGVHIYNADGDVLHASRNILGVHTVSGGNRIFSLPERAEIVYDLMNDTVLTENADSFSAVLEPVSPGIYYFGEKKSVRSLREL